jgi:hypothetical protein
MAFLIFGSGVCAGGSFEAISKLLLAARSSKSNEAYVLIQHLDSERESLLLPEILEKKTPVQDVPIHEGLIVEPIASRRSLRRKGSEDNAADQY